jgi:hypothetical protein
MEYIMNRSAIILAMLGLLLLPITTITSEIYAQEGVVIDPMGGVGINPMGSGQSFTYGGVHGMIDPFYNPNRHFTNKPRKRRNRVRFSQDTRFLGGKRGQAYSNHEIDQSSSTDYQMDISRSPERFREPLPPHIEIIEGDNSAWVSSGEKGPTSGDGGASIVVYGSDGTQTIVQPNQAKKTFEDGTVVYGLDKQ